MSESWTQIQFSFCSEPQWQGYYQELVYEHADGLESESYSVEWIRQDRTGESTYNLYLSAALPRKITL